MTTQIPDAADAGLVAMAKVGDQSAMDELISRYWSMAYRVAVRILHSHEDAEDVAQDAVWAALTHLASYREDACFRTWLHRITVNHSLMALRRRRSKSAGSVCQLQIDALPGSVVGPRTPEDLLLEAECRSVVNEGLSRVPPKYSVALRLAASEGRSTHEIAQCMGLSVTAVKTRVHRGRAYLRREVMSRLSVKTTGAHQRAGRFTGESAVAAA